MKQIISILAFAAITSTASAQTTQAIMFSTNESGININSSLIPKQKEIDTAFMEFTYEYRYSKDTTDLSTMQSDLMLLQVGKNIAKFSSIKQMQIDSIIRTSTPEELRKNSSFLAEGDPKSYFKNYPKGKFTTTDKILSDWLIVEENIEPINWKIKSETKEILGYTCRRAETFFKGRLWIVWYTDAISAFVGPWKLDGLPGLVCEATDAAGHYSFSLMGINPNANSKIIIPDTQFNKSSPEKYFKAKRNYLENPLASLNLNGAQLQITDGNGNKLKESDLIRTLKYDFIER